MKKSEDHLFETEAVQENASKPPALLFGSIIASAGLAAMILQTNMSTNGLIYLLLGIILSCAVSLVLERTPYAAQITQWCTNFSERRSGMLLLGTSATMILVSAVLCAFGLFDAGYVAFGASLILQGIWVTGSLSKHGWKQPTR